MFIFIKRYWKYILIVFLILIVSIISYITYYNDSVDAVNDNKLSITIEEKGTKEENKIENIKTVFVDVKGAVNAPGVYEVDSEKRIIDAINLAGGLTENADTINLNLSKKVSDEMYIIVYTKTEIYNYKKDNEKNDVVCASVECVCPDIKNDACINSNNTTSSAVTDSKTSNDSVKISINTATKEELMNLSGIGEAKAEAIISYRNENGNFNFIDEIKNVSGIGDALYEKIKNNIRI